MVGLLFERTTLNECVSIDIAEKYKVMSLEGHNQAKKKQHWRVGLGHQYAPNSTLNNWAARSTSCQMLYVDQARGGYFVWNGP